MADHLLPHPLEAQAGTGNRSDGSDGHVSGYEALFKLEVALIDVEGKSWSMQYEGVSCNQQRHMRLTCGWRDFVRGQKLLVGESCQQLTGLYSDMVNVVEQFKAYMLFILLLATMCTCCHMLQHSVVPGTASSWLTLQLVRLLDDTIS